ncbi:MAG TPA: hypothetical protein VLT47_15830, partial [Anaeromyxobacteraceae bacterium]|nr:hypothetical protein [Anaeromyxobacteraceae bacterium]
MREQDIAASGAADGWPGPGGAEAFDLVEAAGRRLRTDGKSKTPATGDRRKPRAHGPDASCVGWPAPRQNLSIQSSP